MKPLAPPQVPSLDTLAGVQDGAAASEDVEVADSSVRVLVNSVLAGGFPLHVPKPN